LVPTRSLKSALQRHLEEYRQMLAADPTLTESQRVEMLEVERRAELEFVEHIFRKLQAICEPKPSPEKIEPDPRDPWRRRPVRLRRDGLWDEVEPGEAGVLVEMLPIYGADYVAYDVIVWRHEDPSRWWLQTGVCQLLGESDVRHCAQTGETLLLVETPYAWTVAVQRHPSAACVLSWKHVDLHRALGGVSRITCATPRLAQTLEQRLAREAKHGFRIDVQRGC
jgi:hypothetical protein